MRIAYVGLTSPILYDHTGDIPSVTEGDRVGNAVLESPFGVLLLFDEIWFACRALCPHNMQSLSYVRFLHEDGVLPDLVDIIRHAQKRNAPAEFLPPSDAIEETVHAYVSRYRQARSRISKALPGRELRGKQSMILWGETVSLHRLFDSRLLPLDLEIVRLLDDERVEFITNSATEVWLQ